MATELASGYVSLGANTQQLSKDIREAFSGAEASAGKAGDAAGTSFAGKFGKGLKVAGLATVGVAGGLLATTFTKGFNRLNAIDQAQAKMRALGMDAKQVQSLMDSANRSVKGTAFGLDEAATAASLAAAAGVQQGEAMDKYLSTIADTAAVAGTSMTEMGSIFGKVATGGKVTGDVLQQLGDRGIAVIPALAKYMKVPMDQVTDMVSKGKVSFQDFQGAMSQAMGGGAKEMGKTFSGAMANMNAALGRLGAKLLGPVFRAAPPVFDAITKGIDGIGKSMGPVFKGLGEKISGALGGVNISGAMKEAQGGARAFFAAFKAGGDDVTSSGFAGMLEKLGLDLRKIWDKAQPLVKGLGGAFKELAQVYLKNIIDYAKIFGQHMVNMWNSMKGPMGSILNTLKSNGLPIIKGLVDFLKDNMPKVLSVIKALSPILAKLAGLIGGAIATAFKIVAPIIKVAFFVLKEGLTIAFTVAAGIITALAPVVDWLVSNLGPIFSQVFNIIGTVVSATWAVVKVIFDAFVISFQALGTAASWLWTNAIQPAFNGIGTVVGWVWGVAQTVFNGFISLMQGIGGVATWLWQNAIVPAWNGISTGISAAWGAITTVFGWFKDGLNAIATVAGEVKDWVVDHFNKMVDFFKGLPAVIGGIAEKLWNPLKDAAKTVFNGIANLWNNTAGKLSFKAPSWVPGIGGKGFDMPKIPTFSDGGWTGPGGKYTPAGIVHADEFVVSKEARGRFEKSNPGALDYLNRTGTLPGYAGGGRVRSQKEVNDFPRQEGLEGALYDWGGIHWGDCSGAQSALALYAAGLDPWSDRRGTGGFMEWLPSLGFEMGEGGPGDFRIGWLDDPGGPGGGHTAGTLPDGTNVEMGGDRGNGQVGGNAAGSNSPLFTTGHAFIRLPGGSSGTPKAQDGTTGYTYPGTYGAVPTPQEQKEPFSAAKTTKEFMGTAGKIVGESLFDIFMPSSAIPDPVALADRYTIKDSDAQTAAGTYGQAPTSPPSAGSGEKTEPEGTKPLPERGQMTPDGYVSDIAAAAKEMNLPLEAGIIGVGAALTEVGNPLKMFANSNLPASLNLPHDAVGSNGTSAGLFQQLDNGAWGTLAERMNAFESAKMFFKAFPDGWEGMAKGAVAQAVQASAFPDRYEGNMPEAEKLLIGKFDRGGIVPTGISLIENRLGRYEQGAVFTQPQWASLQTVGRSLASGSGVGQTIDARTIVENLTVRDYREWEREKKGMDQRAQMRYSRSLIK